MIIKPADQRERYANGRVDILSGIPPPPDSMEMMVQRQERLTASTKSRSYYEALHGQQLPNPLATLFFSEENTQIVQNGLRAGVYQRSHGKMNVPPQNIDTIHVLMRAMYFQYANFPSEGGDALTREVVRLNKIFLDYAVDNVYNQAVGYKQYLKDASTLVVPLELPQQPDRSWKQLELKNYF